MSKGPDVPNNPVHNQPGAPFGAQVAAEDLTNPETIAAINRAAWALIGLTEAR